MFTGIKHLHVTVVLLFLLLFIIKTFLLVTNKTEQLDKIRAKYKIADMVLGSLMLLTGGYMLFAIPEIKSYHFIKILVALLSIPVGIIAFKKRIKPMAIGLIVLFIYVYGVAETKSLTFKKDKITLPESITDTTSVESTKTEILDQNANVMLANGEKLFNVACVACHGVDGKLGVLEAKDLTISSLSHEEKVAIINNGKGNMTAFKDQLSEQDIEAVAAYVDSMKK